jgi:hypothetical protein
MASHVYDLTDDNFAEDGTDGLVRHDLSDRNKDLYAVAGPGAPSKTPGIYGWCGLCRSFTDFPHECPRADRPVEAEAI